jgi:hypothetical protein
MIPPTGADAHRKRGPWRMKMKDETSRQIMLEIAEGYERLAKHAEERAKKRTNASTSPGLSGGGVQLSLGSRYNGTTRASSLRLLYCAATIHA